MKEADKIKKIYSIIKDDIVKTPLEYSPKLSELTNANVFLKLEYLQISSSFKIRGVLNKIKNLSRTQLRKKIVAASTGNHAAAVAHVCTKLNLDCLIFVPENISQVKINSLNNYGVELKFFGIECSETEAMARQYALANNYALIHPYNDPDIINGQGTLGLELLEQFPQMDTVIAPVGGGGLISGICNYFSDKNVDVVGVQPANASEMIDSVKSGKIVKPYNIPTISDATAGGIDEDSLTFHICCEHLKNYEMVEEEKLKEAVAYTFLNLKKKIEPSAVLPIAALINSENYRGKNVALVLTGRKINQELLTNILNEYEYNNK